MVGFGDEFHQSRGRNHRAFRPVGMLCQITHGRSCAGATLLKKSDHPVAPCVRVVVHPCTSSLFFRWAGWDDDVAYSAERKAAVLKKMLPPNNVPLRRLSQDEGISEATLHSWRKEARDKGQLLPDADAGPEGWSSRDKFAAVVETAAMNAADSVGVLPTARPLRRADQGVAAGLRTG